MPTDLTIVVPAYNEHPNLERLLEGWLAYCREHDLRLVIVNDGSQDGTHEFLARAARGQDRFSVITHRLNAGYGAALKSGLAHASTEMVATMDADGQHDMADILRLRQGMLDEDADLVIAARSSGGTSLYRKIGKFLIRSLAKLLLPNLNVTDLNSGMKLFRTTTVQRYLSLCPDGMAFSDIVTLIFFKRRHKVVEKEIVVAERLHGNSTINTATAFDTVWKILVIVMMFNPIRLFLPVSLGCFVGGLAWAIQFLVTDEGFPIASAILLISGVIFLALGLIAEQLSLLLNRDL